MTLLAWFGTMLQLAGAIGMAERIWRPRTCYMVMAPGATALLIVAIVRADYPQILLMLAFLAINIRGLLRWRA